MSLLNWLNPPVKCTHIENNDIKEEDEPEEGDDDMTLDVTLDLMSNRRAYDTSRDTSTTPNSRPKCCKQSKYFNTVWLRREKALTEV